MYIIKTMSDRQINPPTAPPIISPKLLELAEYEFPEPPELPQQEFIQVLTITAGIVAP